MPTATATEGTAAAAAARHGTLRNVIGGALIDVDADTVPVHAPATGAVIAHVPMSGAGEVDAAVNAARAALPAWSAPPMQRIAK